MLIGKVFILKFIKFCVVGFSGMIVDFGVTWLLKEKAKVNKYFANSIGFTIAASSNYIFNRYWTFHSKNPDIGTEYFSFIGISLIGLTLNNIIIYLLNEKFNFNFYMSKFFAIAIVTIWNFTGNYFLTYNQ